MPPKPTHRVRGKTTQAAVDDAASARFWQEFAGEAAVHAAKSEKAAKIIRDTVITKKAAGRTKPAAVEYQRTTTQKSKVPIKS